jgi:hypothetical protein
MAEENEDLKVNEQADGSAVIGDEPQVEQDDDGEDERLTAGSDDAPDGDEQISASDSDAERAAKTERNRQSRQAAKEHRREKLETLRRELAARDRIINELNQRVAVVERKSSGSEMAQLEKAEQDAVQAYNYFKNIHSQAVEQANGAMATDAAEKMNLARQRAEQVSNIKRAMSNRQAAPQPLDPRLANHAQDWMSKNTWYNPDGKDEDSEIALIIDKRLANEGWDPTTPEYWEELGKRVEKRLPHRASRGSMSQSNGGKRNPPPVSGSGRESSSSNSQGSYKLSPERVSALKDAGIWDDPKARADAIKRFQSYDKEQRA